jgi:glycosyltransferase involved in cell wall biosynthesis
MHILLPTDVFPPGSVGGAAWSAHTLARALHERGHQVAAVVPTRERRNGLLTRFSSDLPFAQWEDALGVPTLRWRYDAPPLPFVQNYYRHERLWPHLASLLCGLVSRNGQPAIIHAQHVQTTPAAVLAGQQLDVPVVATVRDHWPWDYFATAMHGTRVPYPQQTWASLVTDLPYRLGAVGGIAALSAVPYMLAHVRRRAAYLACADAVVAVSRYMAERLCAIVPEERIHVIPNMVDIAETRRIAAQPPGHQVREPFLLYVGKLERNKLGTLLQEIFAALAARGALARGAPHTIHHLVIAGSGALQPELERFFSRLQRNPAVDLQVTFLAWASHDEVLRLMARCALLLFPSAWGEPLSRVLLEASALGAPIVAMPTGGTADVITDGVNGVLARTPAQVAGAVATLLQRPHERRCLSEQAQQRAQERFAVAAVLPQVEHLYRTLQAATPPRQGCPAR